MNKAIKNEKNRSINKHEKKSERWGRLVNIHNQPTYNINKRKKRPKTWLWG